MTKPFLDVFKNLDIDDYTKVSLKDAEVIGVNVSSERDRILIYIKAEEEIAKSTLINTEESIRKNIFDKKNISVHIFQISNEDENVDKEELKDDKKNKAEQQLIESPPDPKIDLGSLDNKDKTSIAKTDVKVNDSGKPRTKRSKATLEKDNNLREKVIFGHNFSGKSTPLNLIKENVNEVIVSGNIFDVSSIKIKNGRYVVSFNLSDKTDSISGKIFCEEKTKEELLSKLKGYVSILGTIEPPNRFNEELTLGHIKSIKSILDPSTTRNDTHKGKKRIEFNLHTKMSDMDGISGIGSYIDLADRWGWKALCITDSNSVQAFPEAAHSLPKESRLKLIYGLTGSLVNDDKNAVINPRRQSLSGEFVVFDLETTGFSMQKDLIIEIGAVRIKDGRVTERFSQFVDPERPLPENISRLTSISDENVKGAGNYTYWIPKFLEFIGDDDVPVVGHNAMFDVGFIKNYASLLGLKFDPTVVDTLGLSHMLLKHLSRNRLENVARELGLTLRTHHRAVNDAEETADIFLRFSSLLKERGIENLDELYDADVMDVTTIKKLHAYPFSLIALNDLGRINLYRLISSAHIDYFYNEPRMPKSLINDMRNGILVGSGNEEGEIYDEVLRGAGDDEILKKALFYDYFEVMPPDNLRYLINDADSPVESMEDIYVATRRIIDIANKLSRPVIASGNVHFSEYGDSIFRKIIKYNECIFRNRNYDEEKFGTELFLRTTDEMLSEFDFLGKELAEEIVVENTNTIADMCEPIKPVRPDKCPPIIENSDKELKDTCYETAHALYGENLPDILKERLEKELNSIISNGYSVMYIIAKRLVKDSVLHGYLVGSRGSVGSSLAAFLAGISEINPLPSHYRCPNCHHYDFDSKEVFSCINRTGYDLPDKICPVCSTPMSKDGFGIPFETFLGFNGEKEPDIDLNFAGEYQSKAHAYTEELFGKGQTYRAGTIGTVQKKTAYGYVLRYYEDVILKAKVKDKETASKIKNIPKMRRSELERLAAGCMEIRRSTGQHPGGIVVLPKGEEINSFTPIQYPANVDTNMQTTHLDYHSIDHNLLKFDILGKDDPSMMRELFELTGLDPLKVPVGTNEVMSLFKNTEALGISPKDIGETPLGTMGIPEFGTDFAMQMLLKAKPRFVSDLVRIAGLAHGTDVWLGNAEKLISDGVCTIDTAICTRDDIMLYLMSMGVDPEISFKIMELVRKGLFQKDENHDKYAAELKKRGVPEWYILSCDRIKYMFPKAHAAAYVVMSLRIAYYKVHYPLEYYAAYFTVKGKGFDYKTMCVPVEKLRKEIKMLLDKINEGRDVSDKDRLRYRDIRLAEEMMARGFEFVPIDIFKANASRFIITEDKKIMPSLNSIADLGLNAAIAIEFDAKKGPYLSVDEFVSRTKVPRSRAEDLKELGLLGSIPQENQLSLFDLNQL